MSLRPRKEQQSHVTSHLGAWAGGHSVKATSLGTCLHDRAGTLELQGCRCLWRVGTVKIPWQGASSLHGPPLHPSRCMSAVMIPQTLRGYRQGNSDSGKQVTCLRSHI